MGFNTTGEPRLSMNEIRKVIVDLQVMEPQIKRLAVVVEYADKSVSYIRAAAEGVDESILPFIGMLDFAKMGYFDGLTSVAEGNPVDEHGLIGDVSWVEDGMDA